MRRVTLAALILLALVAFTRVAGQPTVTAGMPADLDMSLDCDIAAAGIQSQCTVQQGLEPDVNVVLTNESPAPIQLGAFHFTVHNPDDSRLHATFAMSDAPGHSGNPDLDPAFSTPSWVCNAPPPDNDTRADADDNTQQSFLGCFNGNGNGLTIAPGASVVLARIDYIPTPPSGSAGSVFLYIESASVSDATNTTRGTCPAFPPPMDCGGGATITVPALSMLVDCSTAPGIQSKCYVSNTLATKDVNVVVRNNYAPAFPLGSFGFELAHLDDARLFAPAGTGGTLDSNPDFIAATTGLAGWNCGSGPGAPDNDTHALPSDPGQLGKINCFQGSMATQPVVGAGATLALATVHYDIVAGADPGSIFLTIEAGGIFDSFPQARGACDGAASQAPPMDCIGAELVFYCQIAQADAVHDGRVNSGDLGKVASKFGVVPAPANEDQNFDGMINSGDLGLVASVFNQYVTACP